MADSQLVYKVNLNIAQAQNDSKRLVQSISAETKKVTPIDVLPASQVQQSTQAVRQLGTSIRDAIPFGKMGPHGLPIIDMAALERATSKTKELKTEVQRVKVEAQAASQQMANIGGAAPTAGTSGGLGGLGGLGRAALGGIAGYLTIQGARAVAANTLALTEYGNQVRITAQAFTILSGGASVADANLRAIQAAGRGTIDSFTAMQTGLQALTLNLAKTPEEFGRLTEAAMRVAQVSPVINDVQSAITELGLASANLSFRRLDQLGLSVGEVKDRMAELKAENADLDDSQAFLTASVDLLISKYKDLPFAVTGVQQMKTAFAELRTEIALLVNEDLDGFFGGLTNGIQGVRSMLGTLDVDALLATLRNLDAAGEAGRGLVPDFAEGAFGFDERKRELNAVLTTVEQLKAGLEANSEAANKYKEEIAALAAEYARWRDLTDEQVARLEQLRGIIGEEVLLGVTIALPVDEVANQTAAIEAEMESAFNRITELFAQADAALAAGIPGADQMAQSVIALAQEIANQGQVTDESAQKLNELEGWYNFAANAANYFAGATGNAGGAAGAASGQIAGMVGPLSAAEAAAYGAGDAMAYYRAQLGQAAAARVQFANSQRQTESALLSAAKSVIPLVGVDKAFQLYQQQQGVIGGQIQNLQQAGISGPQFELAMAGFVENMKEPFEFIHETERERQRLIREQEAAQKKAQREAEAAWKKAAKDTQAEFKKAAKALESDLRSVPGLFGTSSVTQDQLDLAKMGVDQNFADDWLRRLKDEVENGVDWEDVSIEEAAQRAGIDPNLPAEVILKQFEEAWRNSSLFADPANLELINQEAVQSHLDLQDKIKTGQQNILEFFGATVDEATGSLGGGVGGGIATDFAEKVEAALPKVEDFDLSKLLGDFGTKAMMSGSLPQFDMPDAPIEAGKLSVAELIIAEGAIEKFISDVAGQFASQGDSIKGQGSDYARLIGEGFTGYEHADLAQDLFEDFGTQAQEKQDDFKGQGAAIAGLHDQGYKEAERTDLAGTILRAMALQFVSGETTVALQEQGRWLALVQDQGYKGAERTGLAEAFLVALGTDLADQVANFASQGGTVAALHDLGYINYEHDAGLANDFFLDLGTQFQGELEKFQGQGAAVAGLHDQGYMAAERGDMAGTMLNAITLQLVSENAVATMKGQGSWISTVIANGITGFNFAPAAGTILTSLRSGFGTEQNMNLMLGVGGGIASIIRDGLTNETDRPGWADSIANSIMSAITRSMADQLEAQ